MKARPRKPRIAIPLPHSVDREYAERAIPQYEEAVRLAGGEPVRIPLDQSADKLLEMVEGCDGVLLPGSKADIDPDKYGAPRHPKTEAADSARDDVDELLLKDAYETRKPVLGICFGLQSLNVYRSGTLVQHLESGVNHAAGRTVPIAHEVEIDRRSRLAEILHAESAAVSLAAPAQVSGNFRIPVNSSHHQSAETVGKDLRVVARCPDDDAIEALEGTSPDHFVLAVQWHPERSYDDGHSRQLFRALVEAAEAHQKRAADDRSEPL